MILCNKSVPTIWATLFLLLTSGALFAQGKSTDSHGRTFGVGQPRTVQDLPRGQLRKSLEGLPANARGKALGWLQAFSFPVEDVEALRAGFDGSIHYADTFEPGAEATSTGELTADSFAADVSQVFQLHSKPGASNVVFLDFDGHTISGTAWSSNTLVALPFDPSQNDNPPTTANFTTDELNYIAEIWHRVSEDFSAFNIDVTTEEPAVFTSTTGRVLFTHSADASGQAMPSDTYGGIAYINVFGNSNYAAYSPVMVYYTNLANYSVGLINYNAEVASHEFGHNLGLSHDGATDGTTYYSGHGDGLVSWGPIMGYMLDKNVTQWSKGEYAGANNAQNDLSIIAGKLGYVGDDHGDTPAQATALVLEANGDILVSSPELDPDNVLSENKGVIEDRNDVDWFYLDVNEPGILNIAATPAWHSFTRSDSRGANLDIELALYDSDMTLLDLHEPDNDTNATVLAMLDSGRYYLQIDGVGNNTNSNYSDYASVGMYFLEGSLSTGPADTTPPSPAIMSWEIAPHAMGESSIDMTAVQATDESANVEYYFSCVAGGNGCADSGWQSSRSYTATGLSANTFYSYTVKARDTSGNSNSTSSPSGATTDAPVGNQTPVAVASYTPKPAIITKGKTASVTLDGAGSSDPDGTITGYTWKDASGATLATSPQLQVKLNEGSHLYTLTVTDNEGATDSTGLTVSVTKSSSDGGGGGGKPCNPRKQVCN